MSKTEMAFLESPDLQLIQVAAQTTRLRILNLLTKHERMYASKIGEILNTERKVIAFHLKALEDVGLLKSEYGLTQVEKGKRPVAARYFKLTPKGKDIYILIEDMLKRSSK